MAAQFKAGTYTGTGSAITLQLGFIPEYMHIVNITDGNSMELWFDGMTADTGVNIAAAVASNANNSLTRYTGTAGANSSGVTIGTDMSTSAKVYRYIALAKI